MAGHRRSLAFSRTKGKHSRPNFFLHSKEFAADNHVFLDEFFSALEKMSNSVSPAVRSGTASPVHRARITSVASLDKLLQPDIPAAEEDSLN